MPPFQRSHSAPHFTAQSHAPQEYRAPRRTKTAIDFLATTSQFRRSPITTPRSEREDPFNLGGFFPSELRPSEETEEWSWLRYGHGDEDGGMFDIAEVAEPPYPSLAIFGSQAEPEADAGAIIKGEDKLGVLLILNSLGLPYSESHSPDDRLYSPYTDDEPCDEESLHMALCARRAAEGVAAQKASGSNTPLGELFFPATEEERAEDRTSWSLGRGLTGVLHEGLRLLAALVPIMRTVHPFAVDTISPMQMASAATAGIQDHLVHSPPNHHTSRPSSPPHTNITQLVVNAIANPPPATSSSQHASHPQNSISSATHTPPPVIPTSISPISTTTHSPAPPPDSNVSIQSILAASSKKPSSSSGQQPPWNISQMVMPMTTQHELPPAAASRKSTGKRKLDEADAEDPHPKIRRVVRDHVSQDPARVVPMTTVICLHAAVAQKSYGSEKRFLCPPPVVHIEGPVWQMRQQTLSMSVVSETGERAFEQKASLDNSMTASFKFLHVTGTAKAKSFQLSLEISEPPPHAPLPAEGTEAPSGRVWASFDSAPVTIISKPSKKTAKTRNISSCILAGGPVSLFNRINSQTVRTKYMTIDHTQLCASNVSWSAFNVNVVRRPQEAPSHVPQPVTYGSEIILTDTQSGISTAPLVIRKVDKGKITSDDGGPVSQMQKIALQRINQDGTRHYLSAAGPMPGTPGVMAPPPGQAGTHPLIFQSPRIRDEVKDGVHVVTDEVDDYLCWTIVGISKFQYTFFDAFGPNNSIPEQPITPFPTLFTTPVYRPSNNTLELTVSNFFYEHPKTRQQTPLDVYLGNIGPLPARVYQASLPGPLTNIAPFVQMAAAADAASAALEGSSEGGQVGAVPPPPRYLATGPMHIIVVVEMPPLGDVIKALDEDSASPGEENVSAAVKEGSSEPKDSGIGTTMASPHLAGRSLPLLFIRSSDGVGYHSGRTIACENVFQSMDLSGLGGNPPNSSASIDTGWLAAAQAAAAAEGGLHGWTLRVM